MQDRHRPHDLSKLAARIDIQVRDRIDPRTHKAALRIEKEVAAGRMTLEEAHERLTRAGGR